jgi:hypothetical protein
MARRYDDQEYLDLWVSDGEYPKIHNRMFDGVRQEFPPPSKDLVFLDLCCSTGLLGAHLRELGYGVAFADGDEQAVVRGKAAGTYGSDPLWFGQITMDTVESLGGFMAESGVTDVAARRCLCVLSNVVPLDVFGRVFADAGAKRLLLEGQVISSRAKQPNGAGKDQAAGLVSSGRWEIVTRVDPDVFYLEAV